MYFSSLLRRVPVCYALFSIALLLGYSLQSSAQQLPDPLPLQTDIEQGYTQVQNHLGEETGLWLYVRYRDWNVFRKYFEPAGRPAEGVALVYLNQVPQPDDWNGAGITGWAFMPPQHKLHPMLTVAAPTGPEPIPLLIRTLPRSPEDVAGLLHPFGGKMESRQTWKKYQLWEVRLPADSIPAFAAQPEIQYIQPAGEDQVFNQAALGFTGSRLAQATPAIGGYGLEGTGVTIGIGDNAHTRHIDYIDRVLSFSPAVAAHHGTHVTGTAAGNGIMDERFKGFAPKAGIVEDFFSQIVANAETYYSDFEMRVTNNSYGRILGDCISAGTYDLYSFYLDEQAQELPQLLHVFAAANDGNATCSPFPPGYGTVTGSYSTAKNVLTVANIGKTRELKTGSSSRGPVRDGRLKPEITALGTRVYSTVDLDSYGPNTGTSMASPNVAGAATLLYQRYKQHHGNQNPAAALIKNLLMNGADDIDIPGPDFRYGFGLMNLAQSIRILDSNRFFLNQLQTGQEQSYTIQVPPNMALLKVLVYWNDAPANPINAKALVNDLDLRVTGPGGVLLPLVPDASPAGVQQPATPGVDRLNNVEQVVLENPAAGSYTLHIRGFDVPEGPQDYALSYDFVPNALTLQYPLGQEVLQAGDSMFIYWHAPQDNLPFTIEFSENNGGSWQTLARQVPAHERAFKWFIPAGMASGNCRIRVQSGNQLAQSRVFSISGRPVINLQPVAVQCPGSLRFSWSSVDGATGYKVYLKQGAEMREIGSTSGQREFFISGLNQDSTYWVGVAPVLNGNTGLRSLAASYRPDLGDCSEITQHGDLHLKSVVLPGSGRQFTASALSSSTPFRVQVQNLDNQTNTHLRIAYQLNGGSWQQQDFTQPLGPAATANLSMAPLDLSDTGDYELIVAVRNLALNDPQRQNDTQVLRIRHIPNPPIDLINDFTDSFEAMPGFEVLHAGRLGLPQGDPWDFEAQGRNGRLRSYVNSSICLSGDRSLSLDNTLNEADDVSASSQNLLTGTFNLAHYDATHMELRCSFDYLLHGVPKFDSGNQVWLRGHESEPWMPLFTYLFDTLAPGVALHSGALSLSDALAAAGQQFSSSSQIRFGQRDTSQIAAPDYGNGLTLDNFSLFMVHNDVMLVSVDSLYRLNCNLSDSVPLQITLANGVHNTIYDIQLYYRLNDQPVVSAQLDSLTAKDTILYTFPQRMDLSAPGEHQLSVWVFQAADSYRLNDSILNLKIRNQELITEFPYLQDFESGDGGFFAEGLNSSWAYGTPASDRIRYAASGTKAWKTGLEGPHNDLERSFLYTPCFQVGSLNRPMLSFSMAVDLENPDEGTVFDRALIEYTTDGHNWNLLHANGDATNWFPADAPFWTGRQAAYWQVYSVPLPAEDVLAFRFSLQSDQGAAFDGLAIDDIHIYDLEYPLFEGTAPSSPVEVVLNEGEEKDVLRNGEIIAHLAAGANALGTTAVESYRHTHFINADSSQYFIPRSFLVQPENTPDDSLTYRLYVPDADMKRLRAAENCASCTRAEAFYRMGISTFTSPDAPALENGNFEDSKDGVWQFIPYEQIRYVPYDNGYYAEFKSEQTGEFWFNNGGPGGDLSLDKRIFTFTAEHFGPRMALLEWKNSIDEQVLEYHIQQADSYYGYHTVSTLPALQDSTHHYRRIDTPELHFSAAYYRIAYLHQNGDTFYSPVRILSWDSRPGSMWIAPNPLHPGEELQLEWFKGSDKPLHWQLTELSGKKVRSGQIDSPFQGKASFPIHSWGCRPGVYILHIRSGTEQWSFKVVVL